MYLHAADGSSGKKKKIFPTIWLKSVGDLFDGCCLNYVKLKA